MANKDDNFFTWDKLFIAAWALKDVGTPKTPADQLPWPFKYNYTLVFRMIASAATIMYINYFLEMVFGFPEHYLSLLWAILLAFVPLLGSCWVVPLWIVLILMGVPKDDRASLEYKQEHYGISNCYSYDCPEYK